MSLSAGRVTVPLPGVSSVLTMNIIDPAKAVQAARSRQGTIAQRFQSQPPVRYLMGVYPLTQKEYNICRVAAGQPPIGSERDNDLPATQINTRENDAFCQWLNESGTGYKFRRPTRQEWDFACHGPEGWGFPWLDWQADLNEYLDTIRMYNDGAGNTRLLAHLRKSKDFNKYRRREDGAYEFDREHSLVRRLIGKAVICADSPASVLSGGGSSPFGLRHMVGNVHELTATTLTAGKVVALGGAFNDNSYEDLRPGQSRLVSPSYRAGNVGVRLAADFLGGQEVKVGPLMQDETNAEVEA
ncbi:formylglycine-generating enzyme family protein [Candidatus Margulisiibacteriota bacterium]